MEQYMKVLKSYKRMPRTLEDYLRENIRPISFPNGSIIQKKGRLCKHIYFIEKGVVAISYGERISRFKKENDFIISYYVGSGKDIKLDAPRIEALEDVTAWDFTSSILDDVFERFVGFNQHLMIMMVKDMIPTERMNTLCREEDSPSLLYDYLRQHTPDLLTRLAPKHLASFLGVPEQVLLHMTGSNIRTPINMTRRRRKRS